MERNLNLFKDLLEYIEKNTKPGSGNSITSSQIEIPGYTPEQIVHHILLCQDVNFIESLDSSTKGDSIPFIFIDRLTWGGHEFLDNIRNDTVMKKLKKTIAEKGGSFAFDIIIEMAKTIARSQGMEGL